VYGWSTDWSMVCNAATLPGIAPLPPENKSPVEFNSSAISGFSNTRLGASSHQAESV
jgi:hypothetical protein